MPAHHQPQAWPTSCVWGRVTNKLMTSTHDLLCQLMQGTGPPSCSWKRPAAVSRCLVPSGPSSLLASFPSHTTRRMD